MEENKKSPFEGFQEILEQQTIKCNWKHKQCFI